MGSEDITLYLGDDIDSQKASTAVREAGIEPFIVTCNPGNCDFETPLLISSQGVFDTLGSIIWFIGLPSRSASAG